VYLAPYRSMLDFVSATLPKRFSLSLSPKRWRRLLLELQSMERDHSVHDVSGSVEKILERSRAGQQLLIFVRCVVEEGRAGQPEDVETVELSPALAPKLSPDLGEALRREVPLLRATAKYLLTACDRLRRAALHDAWQTLRRSENALTEVQIALDEAKRWDLTMRELSLQHGVVHPLSELVAPLPLGEAELAQLGIPCEQLLNGEDLLAS
jgi:hypothetical protein